MFDKMSLKVFSINYASSDFVFFSQNYFRKCSQTTGFDCKYMQILDVDFCYLKTQKNLKISRNKRFRFETHPRFNYVFNLNN